MIKFCVISNANEDDFKRLAICRFLIEIGENPVQTKATMWEDIPLDEFFVQNCRSFNRRGYQLAPAEMGCTLSHQASLRGLMDSDFEATMIFEDDAIPTLKLSEFIENCREGSFKDRFVHLGGLDGLEYSENVYIRPNGSGFFAADCFSRKYLARSCGYLVGKDVADKLLKAMDFALFTADDYRVIGHEIMPAAIELYPCVRHPVDLQSSLIEKHREIAKQFEKPYLLRLRGEVFVRVKYRMETIIEKLSRRLFGYKKIRYDVMF
jgi:GR25 family glycosyltransferase involved in LPS biosynthesis